MTGPTRAPVVETRTGGRCRLQCPLHFHVNQRVEHAEGTSNCCNYVVMFHPDVLHVSDRHPTCLLSQLRGETRNVTRSGGVSGERLSGPRISPRRTESAVHRRESGVEKV